MTISSMVKSPRAQKLPFECYQKMKKLIEGKNLSQEKEEEICFNVFKEAVDAYHKDPFIEAERRSRA